MGESWQQDDPIRKKHFSPALQGAGEVLFNPRAIAFQLFEAAKDASQTLKALRADNISPGGASMG
jgi:hypothetical protein